MIRSTEINLGRRRSLGVLLAGLFAAGCRVGPEHCVPVIDVPDDWTQSLPDAANDVGIDETWWDALGDPVLSGLVSKTREQNLTLIEAAARIREARAARAVARGGLFPDLDGTGSYTRVDISDTGTPFGISGIPFPPFNYWVGGFDMSWEIDVFGRVRRTLEAADADVEVADNLYNELLVTLIADVAMTYVRVRTLQYRIKFASENVRIQEETLRIAKARLDAGAVSELDVAQARSNLERTRAAIPLLRREMQRSANHLCVLMGESPWRLERDLKIDAELPRPPEKIGVGIPIDLVRQRPDIQRVERELAAQAARVGVATADLYPRFSLVGLFTLESSQFREWFTGESLAYRTGPLVRWNLLDFGRTRGTIAMHRARWDAVATRYEQTVLLAVEEVETALAALNENRQAAESFHEAVKAAREASQIAQRQYTEGAVNFQSLLDAQRFQTELEDRYIESVGERMQSLIQLYKSLGGGWRWSESAPEPDEE